RGRRRRGRRRARRRAAARRRPPASRRTPREARERASPSPRLPNTRTRLNAGTRLARGGEILFEGAMASYSLPTVPAGDASPIANGTVQVRDRPIIPFIEGDGTGPDIWRASQRVFDAAVEKAYGGKKRIAWMEVFAGEKAFNRWKDWLPEETVAAFKE